MTIKYSILITKPREVVWDYTQNYEYRTKWDSAVLDTSVIQTEPERVVRVKTKGRTKMTFVYKLDDRPNKTSLAGREIESPFIESAGGSWTYEDQSGGTLWTQTNTIIFKNSILLPLLLPLYKMMFQNQTKQAMKKAKGLIEKL